METNQKKVTFHNRVKRRYIERAPSADRPNLWYRASYYAETRERERFIRTRIHQHGYSEIEDYLISEGIFTIEQMAIKNITADNSISAVLDEQESQEAKYDHDNEVQPFVLNDKEIALEYLVHSRVSLAQAQSRARRHVQYMIRDIDSHQPDEVLPPQGSPKRTRSPVRSSPTLSKTKMSLVRRRTHYGREVLRREDAPQVVKRTTPAA